MQMRECCFKIHFKLPFYSTILLDYLKLFCCWSKMV